MLLYLSRSYSIVDLNEALKQIKEEKKTSVVACVCARIRVCVALSVTVVYTEGHAEYSHWRLSALRYIVRKFLSLRCLCSRQTNSSQNRKDGHAWACLMKIKVCLLLWRDPSHSQTEEQIILKSVLITILQSPEKRIDVTTKGSVSHLMCHIKTSVGSGGLKTWAK